MRKIQNTTTRNTLYYNVPPRMWISHTSGGNSRGEGGGVFLRKAQCPRGGTRDPRFYADRGGGGISNPGGKQSQLRYLDPLHNSVDISCLRCIGVFNHDSVPSNRPPPATAENCHHARFCLKSNTAVSPRILKT